MDEGNLLRIVNFTCTKSLFSGELTYVLTLENEGGLVFDAVISTVTADALLGVGHTETQAEPAQEPEPTASPQPAPLYEDEEQG